MNAYAHASDLAQHRAGRRLRGDHEATICDEVGHEPRPTAGGRIACACCGIEQDDRDRRIGQMQRSEDGS